MKNSLRLINSYCSSHTLFPGLCKRVRALLLGFIGCSFVGGLQGCVDDVTVANEIRTQNLGELNTFLIDGNIGVGVTQLGTMTSRAAGNTTPSSGNSFHDGLPAEYKLTTEAGHHFMVFYGDSDTALPDLVIPLRLDSQTTENVGGGDQIDSEGEYLTYDNITLIGKSVFSFNDVLQREDANIISKQEFLDEIEGKTGFTIVNFDKGIVNISSLQNSSPRTNGTNAEFLASISRKDLLDNMTVGDYKIQIGNEEFFTMTTSVTGGTGTPTTRSYSFTNLNDVAYIYDSEEQALNGTPLLSGYVERIAAKFTVGFNFTEFSPGDQYEDNDPTKPISNQIFKVTEKDSSTGLPAFELYIDTYNSISYNNEGYTINSTPTHAAINVKGYAFSNIEPAGRLMKYISGSKNYFTNWNDIDNSRCYWAEDPHYALTAPGFSFTGGGGTTTSGAQGYPQQWRLALDTDSIVSLHNGTYKYEPGDIITEPGRDANGNPVTTTYYNSLGETDFSALNNTCVLNYKTFAELQSDYAESKENGTFYSLENTYADPGMKDGSNNQGSWIWKWRKAPFATSTCIFLLCQMQIRDNTNTDGTAFYRDQNNIYYLSESTLLDSKLEILNKVMLSGGNAGLQVLNGNWDSHTYHGPLHDNESQYNVVFLDKVAWNMNSILWIHGPNPHKTGNPEEYWEAGADDLVLIPAEMSGGDGQRLIAPKWMGKDYTYLLAPKKSDGTIDDDPIENTFERGNKIVQINFNHLVALIHKIIGPIDVFTNGYMYYAMPIAHKDGTFTATGTNPSWLNLGNVGVVRNNWYDITIKGVSNVGTPVDMVDQPIVPVMENYRNYINLGVKLMDWHTISQGGIPLKPESES